MSSYPRVVSWARVAALVSFLALAALLYVRYDQAIARLQTRSTAQAAGAMNATLISEAKDIETGVRGFVLTGDEAYLQPYKQASSAMPAQITRVQDLKFADDLQRTKVDRLVASVNGELAVAARTIAVRRRDGLGAAAALTVEGKAAMDEVRAAAQDLNADTARRVNGERTENQFGVLVIRYLMLFLFVFAIAMLTLGGVQLRRELRRRTRAEEALRKAYESVEDRVVARTQELVAALDRLESSERRLRLIVEFGVVHLFTLRPDGSAEYVTAGFPALTGIGEAQTLGYGWMDAVHPDDRAQLESVWRRGIESGAQFDADFRLRTASGANRGFKMRVMPAADERGNVTHWFGALIDMHDQHEIALVRAEALKREQAARADAELANRLKDDFLATVSHELRTPLHAIVGWVHLLKKDITQDRERAIDAIERNALVQARLIDDLLDVSRMIQGRFTLVVLPLDLRGAVQAALVTVGPAAAAKGVVLKLDDDAEVRVFGDDARLQQVAWNLLSNAVKFTPRGGTVTVAVARVGSEARLRVTDTGEGIDPAFLPYVFEPFRQGASRSARAGLGLGLAIVRQIVELHGGTVAVASDGRGKGATFTVMLPVSADARSDLTRSASPGAGGQLRLRVLIAEDDADSAVILGTVLKHRGCDVRTAGTAQRFFLRYSTNGCRTSCSATSACRTMTDIHSCVASANATRPPTPFRRSRSRPSRARRIARGRSAPAFSRTSASRSIPIAYLRRSRARPGQEPGVARGRHNATRQRATQAATQIVKARKGESVKRRPQLATRRRPRLSGR